MYIYYIHIIYTQETSCNYFYSERKKIKINFKNIVHLNFIKEASILKKINLKGATSFVLVFTFFNSVKEQFSLMRFWIIMVMCICEGGI